MILRASRSMHKQFPMDARGTYDGIDYPFPGQRTFRSQFLKARDNDGECLRPLLGSRETDQPKGAPGRPQPDGRPALEAQGRSLQEAAAGNDVSRV